MPVGSTDSEGLPLLFIVGCVDFDGLSLWAIVGRADLDGAEDGRELGVLDSCTVGC